MIRHTPCRIWTWMHAQSYHVRASLATKEHTYGRGEYLPWKWNRQWRDHYIRYTLYAIPMIRYIGRNVFGTIISHSNSVSFVVRWLFRFFFFSFLSLSLSLFVICFLIFSSAQLGAPTDIYMRFAMTVGDMGSCARNGHKKWEYCRVFWGHNTSTSCG